MKTLFNLQNECVFWKNPHLCIWFNFFFVYNCNPVGNPPHITKYLCCEITFSFILTEQFFVS